MTLKERLLTVYRGEIPDVVPWFADLTYWYAAASYRGTLPERWQGDGVALLYQDLGCGCHEHALSLPCDLRYPDVEIQHRVDRDERGRPHRETIEWHTPVGSLRQVKEFEEIACTWAYREYPVKTPADLRVLRFIFENQQATPNYTVQERQIELFGDWGVASSIPPRSPLANLFVIWMGVVNTSYALADAPEEVEATLQAMGAADDPIYQAIERSPAPLVYFGENITGEVVSPRLFRQYYLPYYQRRVPGLHAAGKFIFVHVDGTFRHVLPLLAESGVDCAQSLTPWPVGDVPISEWRELAGPNLVIWGGLPGAYFSPVYPEEVLRATVLECMEHLKPHGRFILCVSDQVPPDGIIERVRMVSELVEEHGHY